MRVCAVNGMNCARIEAARFPSTHVAFIRCAMSPQVLAVGWQLTGNAAPTLRFEEFGSTDLVGKPLDVSRRDPAGKQLTAEDATAITAAKILAGSEGWSPGGH